MKDTSGLHYKYIGRLAGIGPPKKLGDKCHGAMSPRGGVACLLPQPSKSSTLTRIGGGGWIAGMLVWTGAAGKAFAPKPGRCADPPPCRHRRFHLINGRPLPALLAHAHHGPALLPVQGGGGQRGGEERVFRRAQKAPGACRLPGGAPAFVAILVAERADAHSGRRRGSKTSMLTAMRSWTLAR